MPVLGQHGSTTRWRAGCRCDECVTVHHARVAWQRLRTPFAKIPHGPDGYALYGCRCDTCRKAHRDAHTSADVP